ncbi:hypothetical protein Tsubulata_033117 [Turnera subulata]|uniref:Uncharacterized protein n=1 Tax=Turnera subulata TaxID=218843 RepID=A0A9Q0FBY4_9ROSI|nr:hypothetical protein Tsubulata_033117 [Turnera subulata]
MGTTSLSLRRPPCLMSSSSSHKRRVPKVEWRNVAVHLLATSDRVNGLELEEFLRILIKHASYFHEDVRLQKVCS